MRISNIVIIFLIIFISQILFSKAQEMVYVLVPSPNSPISTSSGVVGSFQCTKNSDESYAVCASNPSNVAVKYNLQPFSFAAKGPNQGDFMRSCDLYETSSQTTSRAVCVKGTNPASDGIVHLHRVSDMMNVTNVTIGVTGQYSHVVVDTSNNIAYFGNSNYAPSAIYKITSIGSSSPFFAGTLASFGIADNSPVAMLIIDGFLYVHFNMNPSRLARINISTFTWNQTVAFYSGEKYGYYDNLANDDNFIYDLTQDGILVRFTYKNNNFARLDSLNTGFPNTWTISVSPDSSFLLFTAYYSGIVSVNTSTFSVDSGALLPHPAPNGYVSAQGRPIILTKNNNTNTYAVCGFTWDNDRLYTFNFSRVPFREVYPTIFPLPASPIAPSFGVSGSRQCSKNSDESYAVCASGSNAAIKYNLQPFSFAAKGSIQGSNMNSCDLYETFSQTTSRVVCIKGNGGNGVVYFHRVSDMTDVTSVTIGPANSAPYAVVDTPNQVAYISNYHSTPAIYKIIDIGSADPIVAGNMSSFGSGDNFPSTMLIIDGFLYVHFYMNPVRLARINISSFTWNQTISFTGTESWGGGDNLAHDENFIYDPVQNGVLVRCTYSNNNLSRFDSLKTGYSGAISLAISPDQRTLIILGNQNSVIRMINTTSFSMFGNVAMVPFAFGRPIITSWCNVFAFTSTSVLVYAFRLNSSSCRRTPSAAGSADMSQTNSASTQRTLSVSPSFPSVSISSSNSETISIKKIKSTRTSSRDATSSTSITKSLQRKKEKRNSPSPSLTHSEPDLTVSKVVPRVDPVPALPGLTGASSAAGAIAAFSGVGAVAAQQNRLAAVASLVHCGEGEGIADVRPDYISSPFQLRIGDDLFGWNRGLLVGNILVLVSFTGLIFVMAFVYSKSIGKCDFQTALLHLRFPGIVMLPTLVLMPPSAEKAVALFWFSKGSGGKDLLLAISCGSILVFAPCVLTLMVCHVSARGRLVMLTEDIEESGWVEKRCPKFAESSVYKLFQYLSENQFEFTDGKNNSDDENNTVVNLTVLLDENNSINNNNDNNQEHQHHHLSKRGHEGAIQFLTQNPWFARIGMMMESFSLFYFAFADIAVSAVVGFMAGTAAGAASFPQCIAIFCIDLIFCVGHLFLLLWYRGVTPRYLFVFMTSASIITLIAVIFALLQYLKKLLNFDEAWEYLGLIQTVLGFFVMILSIIGFCDSVYQFIAFYAGCNNKQSKDFGARDILSLLDDDVGIDIAQELRNLPSRPPPLVPTVTQQQHQQQEEEPIHPTALIAKKRTDNEIDLSALLGNPTSTRQHTTSRTVEIVPETTREPLPANNNDDNNESNLLSLLDELDEAMKEEASGIETETGGLVSASRGNQEMMRNQNELQKMLGR